jgi:membrane protease YdiL (CAAX protease family)
MVSTSNGQNRISAGSFLRLAATGEAGLLLLAWALSRWLDVSPLQQLRPNLVGLLWGISATLPLLLGLAWMLMSPSRPIRQLVALVVDQLGPVLARRSLLDFAALAAVAGISEEILFRGVVQASLTRWLSPGAGLLITSALFGLVHFASRAYAVLAGVMGLYLGTLFLVQGSLIPPTVAHGLYDFVALVCVARRYRVTRAEDCKDTFP